MKRNSAGRRDLRCWALWLLALVLPGGISAQTQEPIQVSMALQWVPQSQFAGYYLALEKGFYSDRGIEMTLIDGGPMVDGGEMLRDGETEFATFFLTGALEGLEAGVPLTFVSQIVNESLVRLVARKDAGILTAEDLQGRRVSLWSRHEFLAAYMAFFAAHGLEVEIVPQHYSMDLFLLEGVDACSAMQYNELYRIYLAGIDWEELTVFEMHEGSLQIPEDGIYGRTDFVRDHPEVARAVAEASLEGWRYAAEHPEEALDVVMRRTRAAHLPATRVHMRWMLENILPSILDFDGMSDGHMPGQLSEAHYGYTVDLLTGNGVLNSAPDFAEFVGMREGG